MRPLPLHRHSTTIPHSPFVSYALQRTPTLLFEHTDYPFCLASVCFILTSIYDILNDTTSLRTSTNTKLIPILTLLMLFETVEATELHGVQGLT